MEDSARFETGLHLCQLHVSCEFVDNNSKVLQPCGKLVHHLSGQGLHWGYIYNLEILFQKDTLHNVFLRRRRRKKIEQAT